MAWQFDRPEVGEGIVQAFRRSECIDDSVCYKLCGLDHGVEYVVTDIDENVSRTISGCDLMETGITIHISSKPGAAILTYKKAN